MEKKNQQKQKKQQENQNPHHKEYGVLSNSVAAMQAMWGYSRKFPAWIALGFFCAPVVQYLWTFLSKLVIDLIVEEQKVSNLILLMAGVTLLQMVVTMLNDLYYTKYYLYIGARFRLMSQKNRKIMTIGFECLEDKDVLDCYQRAGNACNNNDQGVEGMMRALVNLLLVLPVVLVGILILGTVNGYLILGMLLCALLQFAVNNHTNKACKEKVWDPLAPWWRKHGYLSHTTSDFSAAKDIRMFGLREWLLKKYRKLNQERYEAQKTNARFWMAASTFSAFLWAGIQVATYAWLIAGVVKGECTIGNFSLYLTAAMTFFEYMNQMLSAIATLLARSREYDNFRSFMDLDTEKEEQGKQVPAYETYEFTFRNVSFRYPKAETYALENLNLTLKAGERLAVVGLNGAGKSTFIKLLLRLYEPTEGEILLNGVNIKEYNRKSYYGIFSVAFQEVRLFAFSLAENVSMKAPEQTDRSRAEHCLIEAGLGEKLQELERGVDTELLKVLHDDGIDLSGGEKQKLALARVLYKNAPVVVLDEPTAALDALAESRLYQDFDQLIGKKTAVYISHRLSSTQFCDHVAMFRAGKMIEYGTHEELLAGDGAYAEMFRVQAQYYVDVKEGEVAADV